MTVVVSDPHKVGEGMSSYMAYRVSTRYRAAFSGVGGVGGGGHVQLHVLQLGSPPAPPTVVPVNFLFFCSLN